MRGECTMGPNALPLRHGGLPDPDARPKFCWQDPTLAGSGRVSDIVSRRNFVEQLGALGATWMLAASSTATLGVDPHQHKDAPPRILRYFSAADAKEIEAMAERIVPSDDGPGAKEAGALYFIDGGLATFAKDQQPVFRDGLADVAKRVSTAFPSVPRFSSLTAAQQDELLTSMEETPFFQTMRFATIAGMLCLPEYGGNRGRVGWKAIGLQDAPTYAPPFGYYDRPDVLRKLLGGDA